MQSSNHIFYPYTKVLNISSRLYSTFIFICIKIKALLVSWHEQCYIHYVLINKTTLESSTAFSIDTHTDINIMIIITYKHTAIEEFIKIF